MANDGKKTVYYSKELIALLKKNTQLSPETLAAIRFCGGSWR